MKTKSIRVGDGEIRLKQKVTRIGNVLPKYSIGDSVRFNYNGSIYVGIVKGHLTEEEAIKTGVINGFGGNTSFAYLIDIYSCPFVCWVANNIVENSMRY